MNTTAKRRRVLAVAGTLAVLAVLFTYVIHPLSARWTELGETLAPKLEELNSFSERVQDLEELFTRRDALAQRLGSLIGAESKPDSEAKDVPAEAPGNAAPGDTAPAAAVPPGDHRLAAYLETSAAQAGLKIKRISSKKYMGGPSKLRHFVGVSLQLSVGGEAESLLKFLHAVEKGGRFARVDQIEVHRSDAERMVDANLSVSGYQEQ